MGSCPDTDIDLFIFHHTFLQLLITRKTSDFVTLIFNNVHNDFKYHNVAL